MEQEAKQNIATRLPVMTWIRLARVFNKISKSSNEAMRHWNLSLAQFDLLVQLGQAEGSTQQELAERLLVTKGNICQLLNRLEEAHLIVRRPEGRANHLFLTSEGRQLFDEVVPAQEALLVEHFAGLSLDEQRQLHALLRKLDQTVE